MKPKNTICLWFDKDAHEAARFYAVTFPDSKVTAVHEAPGDYPGGKKGDVLTASRQRGEADVNTPTRSNLAWDLGRLGIVSGWATIHPGS